MTRLEMLLVCIMEECSEIQKVCSESLRFGLNEKNLRMKTNQELLEDEIQDLIALIEILEDDFKIEHPTPDGKCQKKRRFERYLQYSEQCGTYTPPR